MRLPTEQISAELDRILHSSSFQHSGRLSRFLRFVVERTLEGGQPQLKEFTVALEVYDKDPGFDPRLDSIVRVEASRLRAKLREYYETEGRENRIRIELPKGGYTPVFRRVDENRAAPRRFTWISAFVLVSLAAALVAVQLWRDPPAQSPAHPKPLTTWPGVEIQPCVSPDGSRVAMVWSGPKGDNYDIYVLRIGDASPNRLTEDPAADRSPAWSRDGRWIAFIRDSAAGRQLRVLDTSNGASREVALLQIPAMFPQLNVPRLVEWSRDGRNLLVADQDSPRGPYSIYLVSVDTGEKRKLTSPPATMVGDRDPAVSSDGQLLAFTRSPSAVTSDIYVMPLSGGEPRRLTSMNQPVRGIAWAEDDQFIVFSSERDATAGRGGLWRVQSGGSSAEPQTEPVSGTGHQAALPSISRHGRVLVYQESFQDSNIWRIPLNSRDDPAPVISSTREEVMPDFSPDGKQIAFCSNRSGHWEIWTANADGANQRQLTHFGGAAAGAPRWSANGRSIAFVHHNLEGSSDVYVMTAEGGSIRRLTTHPARDERPSWSRSGTEVYFHSNRTGDFEVWKVSADDPRQTVQVTSGGGAEPLEDPDGRYLYYRNRVFTEIWRKPAMGGIAVLAARTAPSSGWTVSRGGLYLTEPDGEIIRVEVTGTKRFSAGRWSSPNSMGLAVSPDEMWLMCARRERAASDITVVEGYR